MVRKIKFIQKKKDNDGSEGSLELDAFLFGSGDDNSDHGEDRNSSPSSGRQSRGRKLEDGDRGRRGGRSKSRDRKGNNNDSSGGVGRVLGRVARSISPGTKRRARGSSRGRGRQQQNQEEGGGFGSSGSLGATVRRRMLKRINKNSNSDSEFLRKIDSMDESTVLTKEEERKFWKMYQQEVCRKSIR